MLLWIDNTTLHGAGRCLAREGRTFRDLRSLFQLATLLVFAEKLELGQFEQGEVIAQSKSVRDTLVTLGLSPLALEIVPTTESEYVAAAQATASYTATEIPFRFRVDEGRLLGLNSLDIPQGSTFRPDRAKWIAMEVDDPADLEKIAQESLPEKAMGAVDYMLATSDELRASVRGLMTATPDWSDLQTFQLESMLRSVLNDRLAEQRGGIYAPAPHRGELVHRQNLWLLGQLRDMMDATVQQLRGESLGLPVVVQALVSASGGDPAGFIREALRLREQAAPLRRDLSDFQSRLTDGDLDRHQVWLEIRDLGRAIRSDLGLEGAEGLEAFSFDFPVGLPSASLNPSGIVRWLRDRLSRSKRIALTHVAKSAAFIDSPQDDLRRLAFAALGAEAAACISSDDMRLLG